MAKVDELMKKLNITKEEALQLIEDDKAIDKGADLFPLTAEQKKNAKKACACGSKAPTAYKFDKRERKPNEDKRTLIQLIATAIEKDCDAPLEITNIEREINFVFNGKKYKLVLSAPRS